MKIQLSQLVKDYPNVIRMLARFVIHHNAKLTLSKSEMQTISICTASAFGILWKSDSGKMLCFIHRVLTWYEWQLFFDELGYWAWVEPDGKGEFQARYTNTKNVHYKIPSFKTRGDCVSHLIKTVCSNIERVNNGD